MNLRAPGLGQRRLMVLIVLLGAAFVLFFPARQLVQQRQHIATLEAKLEEMRVTNDRLEAEVERLSDPGELEVLARERLGLVQPGERAYYVEYEEPPAPDEGFETSRPWWERAWTELLALLRGRG